ncbi:MAG: YfhO family protein, partial [Fidelibacterota bacterium]
VVFHLPKLFNQIFHFLIAGFFMYIFIRKKGLGFYPAIFSGVTYMFTPYLITMFTFGHGSQMMTAAYIPVVLYVIDELFQKRNLLWAAIAAVAIGFQLQRGHVQIIYYTWIMMGIYYVFTCITLYREKKEIGELGKITLWLLIALVLAFGIASVIYIPLYNYTGYSIRGTAEGGGTGFDYATSWSFHPKEMMTFLIPSFYGFGGFTYWGRMPFTDYPNYMGIIPLFLAISAFFYRRPKIAIFFGILIVLSLLISFGRHFSIFYKLLYNFLPFFNKFRVPAMMLIMVQFSVAALAGYGLHNLLQGEAPGKLRSKAKISGFMRVREIKAAAVFILTVIISVFKGNIESSMMSVYPGDPRFSDEIQRNVNSQRFDLFFKDLWIVTLIIIGGSLLLILKFAGKVGANFAALGLLALTVMDLWIVDFKLNKTQPEAVLVNYLEEDRLVQYLKRDTSLYRIFPLGRLFNEKRWAAHKISSIGGYHPAKLRIYQEFLEQMGFPNNFIRKYYKRVIKDGKPTFAPRDSSEIPDVERMSHLAALRMLNVKYVIAPFLIPEPLLTLEEKIPVKVDGQVAPLGVYRLKNYLPRAYSVGIYKLRKTRHMVFQELKSGRFDPERYVILEKDPPIEPFPDKSIKDDVVRIEKYDLHEIEIFVNLKKPRLVVLSEIYYPAGWKAFIDGKPAEILKANYILRSVAVPAGVHRIKFIFSPTDIRIGFFVTVIFTFIIASIIVSQVLRIRRK